MKIFSGPLGAVWGPFVMVFIEGDKQTMGPRSTTYKMLTSGAVGRGFEKLRFWGFSVRGGKIVKSVCGEDIHVHVSRNTHSDLYLT